MLVRRLLFFTTHEILRVFRIHLASSLIMGIKTGVSREPLTFKGTTHILLARLSVQKP
ncbi:inorganic polyphosphate kinase [Dickeya dianthicola]|uniref:Inorganic polyphosphate kinase n=1 Tax=Dickeya dianthicola TaxID=204039 RepID=A0AAX1C946_9GAMM|nr:inorganic polyphosphate kinase [Dickeya dianthicola]RJL72448.1 inorganic polyphosphate kinase [Dickeya dianthicola]RJL74144.1 inorganic polyphosphate kinase [Dickeya dianthicola]